MTRDVDDDALEFAGFVVNGRGTHVNLAVPGRSALLDSPKDWPEKLRPGSLNVQVSAYPPEFAARGLSNEVSTLDVAGFEPAFRILQGQLGNNQLRSSPEMPNKGTAQVWRATLNAAGHVTPCWVLRRYGSGLIDELELVSDIGLRAKLNLSTDREDWPATVQMFGRWQ